MGHTPLIVYAQPLSFTQLPTSQVHEILGLTANGRRQDSEAGVRIFFAHSERAGVRILRQAPGFFFAHSERAGARIFFGGVQIPQWAVFVKWTISGRAAATPAYS